MDLTNPNARGATAALWGDFETCFELHPGSNEKFTRLDIGQQQ
jgi:hypothetical protein